MNSLTADSPHNPLSPFQQHLSEKCNQTIFQHCIYPKEFSASRCVQPDDSFPILFSKEFLILVKGRNLQIYFLFLFQSMLTIEYFQIEGAQEFISWWCVQNKMQSRYCRRCLGHKPVSGNEQLKFSNLKISLNPYSNIICQVLSVGDLSANPVEYLDVYSSTSNIANSLYSHSPCISFFMCVTSLFMLYQVIC